MDKNKELQLYDCLKNIKELASYPIIVQDAYSNNFYVKANGTKQGVYYHMVLIRERMKYILDYFFEEEV